MTKTTGTTSVLHITIDGEHQGSLYLRDGVVGHPNEEVAVMLKKSGMKVLSGSFALLNRLVEWRYIYFGHVAWPIPGRELVELFEKLSKTAFVQKYIGRNILSSGLGNRFRDIISEGGSEGDYQVINERNEMIREAFGMDKISNVWMTYTLSNGKTEEPKMHTDTFLHGADIRVIDTIGTSLDNGEEKTITFRDTKTEETVTMTVPHGSVMVLSRRGSGFDGGEIQHQVQNTRGTFSLVTEHKRYGA